MSQTTLLPWQEDGEILPDSPFLSLDSLLSESMADKAKREQEKDMRKKLYNDQLPAQEKLDTLALLRKWDNAREWKCTHNVLVFTRQKCATCGEYHKTFEGRFEKYRNNRLVNTTKVQAVTSFELDLPKEVIYHDAIVPFCHDCADTAGWPLEED